MNFISILRLQNLLILGILILVAALPITANDANGQEMPLVTNIFFETDLRQALKDLSNESGVTIIADNTVQGLVTLEFENEPLESVLKKILSGGGFTFRKINDFYLVGSPLIENQAFPLLTETEYYCPDYLEAKQIPMLLSDFYRPYVRVNDVTNSIAITASPELINQIRSSVRSIDVPPKQILIEAVVTELSNDAKRSLGIDWSWLGESDKKSLNLKTNLNSVLSDSSFTGQLIRSGINYKSFKYDVILNLKALATEGKAKIRANPKITAINGQQASIFIGSERYFSIVTGPVNYPYTQLERIPVGITLKIEPRISSKDEITASIECEVSEVSEIGLSGLPLVTKRNARTSIRVKNGEIIAIGGLTQEQTIDTKKKIPFLGSIPLLGYFFSHSKKEKIEKEISIFIAPHLIDENAATENSE
ncbi:hypothetical protein GF337_16970 [candidate division KSB1 bacterium]|nr:hypothetical protein [candidate division KSB1 bacterium]